VREVEVLTDSEVTLLADRRSRGPYGLRGGRDGSPGRGEVIRRDGTHEPIAGKASVRLRKGERIRLESPGGGGIGR
jgi:N-methylhydantoinase B